KLRSGNAKAKDKIAIIAVEGAILQSDGFVKRQIDRISKDKNVKAAVVRVDSPGGTVTASHYLYYHLKKLKKDKEKESGKAFPMVVSMGSIAASGGYYISMAVGDEPDTIIAEETTWTGSIGVIIPKYNITGLMGKLGIKDVSVASGPLKQMGNPTRDRTTAERQLIEKKFKQLVTESFQGFKEVVAYGRPDLVKNDEAMKQVVTGQIFTAKQALEIGLVDKLGYLEDAIDRAAELADLDSQSVRVVKYQQPQGLLDIALGGQAQSTGFDLARLVDLTAPRAYYLCTWMPVIVSNQ
ncbi:MAG: signal peptide peptidase SppA, partial [Planctomycetales bacterium]